MTRHLSAIVQTVATPDGAFTIITDDLGRVLASGWSNDHQAMLARIRPVGRPTQLVAGTTSAADAVDAYYAGELDAVMNVPVAQSGTELQRLGWDALRGIAPGAPLSYTEFAELIGSPGAVRPAASICARNAAALFVPCHRVLRGDGSLGGFAWGVQVKHSLLTREYALS